MLATTIQITNNPPHTPKTQETKPSGRACGQPPHSGGRSHGVEREPDSVSARITFYAQPKHAPTPTTHHRAVNTCRHKKTTKAPTHRTDTMIVPHNNGLPRKEVIQPHLPVRLPCYDFVPIANPTFDHSPRTSRLGHGLRVLPTFVT